MYVCRYYHEWMEAPQRLRCYRYCYTPVALSGYIFCALCSGWGVGQETFICSRILRNGAGVRGYVKRSASMSVVGTCLMSIAFLLLWWGKVMVVQVYGISVRCWDVVLCNPYC